MALQVRGVLGAMRPLVSSSALVSARRWGHGHAAGPTYTIAYETGVAGPAGASQGEVSNALKAAPEFFFDVEDGTTAVERAKEYALKNAKIEAHAAETSETWKKISLFLAIPIVVATTVWAFTRPHEHHEHVAYPHLRIRHKPFPWGNDSFFHNPEINH
eukprot:comp17303_c0_seq1/m.16465 comp17303_c0_seq1/g.16465  ORF comp17303_c0_seq1/g.16465 comp17303_c0_seq1/m.16465 type:complete len:159 (-) comp17303_c0_seq1:134-610(-)